MNEIEQGGIDLLSLLLSATHTLGINTHFQARISVEPTTQVFRQRDAVLGGHYRDFDETQRVYDFTHVDGPVLLGDGYEAACTSWAEVIRDAVNQTGAPCGTTGPALIDAMRADD